MVKVGKRSDDGGRMVEVVGIGRAWHAAAEERGKGKEKGTGMWCTVWGDSRMPLSLLDNWL